METSTLDVKSIPNTKLLSLTEAAALTGLARSTLLRRIRSEHRKLQHEVLGGNFFTTLAWIEDSSLREAHYGRPPKVVRTKE